MAHLYWSGAGGENWDNIWQWLDGDGNTYGGLPSNGDAVFFNTGVLPTYGPGGTLVLSEFHVASGVEGQGGVSVDYFNVRVDNAFSFPLVRSGHTLTKNSGLYGLVINGSCVITVNDPLPPAPPAGGGGPLGGPEIGM